MLSLGPYASISPGLPPGTETSTTRPPREACLRDRREREIVAVRIVTELDRKGPRQRVVCGNEDLELIVATRAVEKTDQRIRESGYQEFFPLWHQMQRNHIHVEE